MNKYFEDIGANMWVSNKSKSGNISCKSNEIRFYVLYLKISENLIFRLTFHLGISYEELGLGVSNLSKMLDIHFSESLVI